MLRAIAFVVLMSLTGLGAIAPVSAAGKADLVNSTP